ncbi:MAG: hypothetical protein ACLRSY_01415 [Acutalibacter sp.]
MKDLGAQLLIETLEKLEQAPHAHPQGEAQATHAPMLSKELSLVDWITRPAGPRPHPGLNPGPRRLLSGREKLSSTPPGCGGQRPAR